MPIYEVILNYERAIFRVGKLDPDEEDLLPIDFYNLMIPIKVHKNDEVTIYLKSFRGDLGNLVVATYKDKMWNKDAISVIREITLKPENEGMAFGIYGDDETRDGYLLVIMRFEKTPEVGTRVRLERG